MEQKKPQSKIEVYIQGNSLIIYEYFSHGIIEKILEQAGKDYGIVFDKKCRSMCG